MASGPSSGEAWGPGSTPGRSGPAEEAVPARAATVGSFDGRPVDADAITWGGGPNGNGDGGAATLDGLPGDGGGDGPRPMPEMPGYELLRELARGGMGVVYLARTRPLERLCALKMILAGAHAERPDGTDIHEATSRAEAIRAALALADDKDTIIITGKGHEPTQEIAGVFHRYNDRDVLLAAVRPADPTAASEAAE